MEPASSIQPVREPDFRLAHPEDLNSLLELYGHLHLSEPVLDKTDKVVQAWNEILSDPKMFCFVMAEPDRLVASCVLAIIPNLTRDARPFGILQNVVTLTAERGKGYGKTLIGDTLKFAWDRDCYQVLVQSGQPPAIPFYKKLGFRDDVKVGLVAKPEW